MSLKKIYLIGNAHLDPVWQWRWQEGSAEAKATVRSALDRTKEFPDFRFVCSSVSVYQWVEEFVPEMFEELRERVKEGRFVVVGGWHVQPDCNLPSGEAFARQSLYAQRYFRDTLGVTAKVGYSPDSFGHNAMMPQILKKSGMDSYVFMRPGPHEKDLDSELFEWVAPDGSSVTACRIPDPYCFQFDDMNRLEERMTFLEANSRPGLPVLPFFYGVGNHGGGPTVRHLELLEQYGKEHPEKNLIYSDLHDFFEDVRNSGTPLPELRDDLQHHAPGCPAAVHRVKEGVRRSESALCAAEAYGMLASALCGKKPKNKVFEEAWKNVCFCHFHDAMDGCSIRAAYDDTDLMLSQARHAAAVEENNALQSLSWIIDTSDREKGLPVVVFNPHGFDTEETVQVNKQFTCVKDCDGNPVPSQLVRSASLECHWRSDTLFRARVPALGYAVYYLSNEEVPVASAVSAIPWRGPVTANERGGTILENEIYRIRFEQYSGYITSFTDKRTGREIINGRAAVPTVIDEYYHDTWSHAKSFFTDEMARFSDAKVTVTEEGPVRATVKVVSRYNDSALTQYFSLESGSDRLSVRARADWHEKHKMLKLAWPMAVEDPEAYYEIPFGVMKRPTDGEEEPGLRWTAVKGNGGGYAVVNDSTYSSSVKGGTICHTVLRSPIYGDHGGPRTEESEYTDQGRIDFRYILMPAGDDWTAVTRAAAQLNKPVTNIIETWHPGRLSDRPYAALKIDCPNIMLSAIKRSEDGTGLVVRLYETTGKTAQVTVSGDLLPVPLTDTVTPWSVETYYLADGAAEWKKVLLTEYDI